MNKFDYRTALINLLKSILITRCGANPSVELRVFEVRSHSVLQVDEGSDRYFLLDLDFFNDAEDVDLIKLLDDFIEYFKGELADEQK